MFCSNGCQFWEVHTQATRTTREKCCLCEESKLYVGGKEWRSNCRNFPLDAIEMTGCLAWKIYCDIDIIIIIIIIIINIA